MSYFLTRSPESLEMQSSLHYNESQAVCHGAVFAHRGLQHTISIRDISCHQAFTWGAISIPHSITQQPEATAPHPGGIRHLEQRMPRAQILLDKNLQLE